MRRHRHAETDQRDAMAGHAVYSVEHGIEDVEVAQRPCLAASQSGRSGCETMNGTFARRAPRASAGAGRRGPPGRARHAWRRWRCRHRPARRNRPPGPRGSSKRRAAVAPSSTSSTPGSARLAAISAARSVAVAPIDAHERAQRAVMAHERIGDRADHPHGARAEAPVELILQEHDLAAARRAATCRSCRDRPPRRRWRRPPPARPSRSSTARLKASASGVPGACACCTKSESDR